MQAKRKLMKQSTLSFGSKRPKGPVASKSEGGKTLPANWTWLEVKSPKASLLSLRKFPVAKHTRKNNRDLCQS
jgi:hypothetical protein